MRLARLCSAVLVLCVCAAEASAQVTSNERTRSSDRIVVGGTTFGDVLRIVGSPTVASGTGTMNPSVIDADGDVLEDTFTTVSTAGAHTWGAAGSFGSTLGVTGNVTGGTGTLLLASPTRISTTAPIFLLHESDAGLDEKYTQLLVENDELSLDLISDALGTRNSLFRTQRVGLLPGDWRWGSALFTVRPENNGVTSLGTLARKYLTVHAWELWVQTLVAQETIATIGGHILVAPTTKLVLDMGVGDLCISLEHNDARVNDTVLLQKNGRFEKILLGTNAFDCRISGNCGFVFDGYNYCGLTRNRDGTGANAWDAGDAVVNEGNVGDGYIDLYALRSATAEGYFGLVMSAAPVAYYRMDESPSGQTTDKMGNVGNAVETGTQSNGLGVGPGPIGDGVTVSDPVWQNNAASGYLLVAHDTDLQITGDLTIEFWAFWEDGGGADNLISRGPNGEFHLQVNPGGQMQFCHGNGSTTECETTGAGFLPVSVYTHIAVVRDATSSPKRVLWYKNGVFVSSSTYTQAVTAQTLSTAIGENPAGLGNPFDGNLDEVAFYNYQVPGDRLLRHVQARTNNSISKFTIGPTQCGNVRTGLGAFDVAERWCLGNLAGTYNYNSASPVYGFAAGNVSATWISADATNGFRIMNGGTTKLQFDTSGDGFLSGSLHVENNVDIGTGGVLTSGAIGFDNQTGYWLDYNGGSPRFRIGTTTAGTSYLRWTGTALQMKSNTLNVDANGIEVSTNTAAAFGSTFGYRFTSGLLNSMFGAHAFETSGGRVLALVNTADTPGKPVTVQLQTGASSGNANVILTNDNAGIRSVELLAIGSLTLANQTLSTSNITSVVINGNTAFNGACSAASFTVTHGIITSC